MNAKKNNSKFESAAATSIVDCTMTLEQLTPYHRNARRHPQDQIDLLAKNIKAFGFTAPIIIDEHCTILAGHGRYEAAKIAGMTEVPCRMVHGLSEEKKRGYMLADNKLGLNSEWDADFLRAEVLELKESSFDLGLTGFKVDELQFIEAGYQRAAEPEPEGENLDQVATTVKVQVQKGEEAMARAAIEQALTAAGVTYALR